MAVFGAIKTQEYSPLNAIRAAVKMLVALDLLNKNGTNLTSDKIDIGIGINCGQCTLGNIGFKNKMDYTIIGDTVNLASRTESLTKTYHHPLIVTEFVFEETKENFLFRKIDNVRVKGKNKPVGIYAVYSGFNDDDSRKLRSGRISDLPSVSSLLINRSALVNYNKGLQVFYLREWKLSAEYFMKALEFDNKDYLSKLYLDRALFFDKTPPSDDWDSVITLEKK
jgi:adenylate cyclase